VKPIVNFKSSTEDYIQVGNPAFVTPVDHPDPVHVSNHRVARTSEVTAILEDGFETKNTLYKRLKSSV
jgi:hypothetical protein